MLKNRRLLTLVLASSLLLSACGFKLRGTIIGTDLPFKSMYISATSALGGELRRYIRGSGELKLTDSPEEAEAILDIVSEQRNKVILSLNSQGRVREYVLYYNVTVRVRNNAGIEYMSPTTISLKRELSYNESQVLAKEAEEVMLYRDMQSDLVQQILRRIAAIKPVDNATAD